MVSPKLRVLFIMHVPPPVHGAAMMGSYIRNSAVINDLLDTTYINLATSTKLSQSGKAGFYKLFVFFRLIFAISRTLSSKRFDLCYISLTASGPGFYKDLIIVTLVKIARIQIIYHFHNKGIADASKSKVNRLLYRFAFKGTKSILLSPHLYPDLKQYVNQADVFYCPNGIPEINPLTGNAESPSIDDSLCTFLYLSNMMHEKGAYVLLDALIKLNERKLSFHCHFIGGWFDITESDFLYKITEGGLSEIVTTYGPLYGKEKEAFWSLADVFVFPTFYHYEAFPLVNLEAMQHALPIVSTPEGGIPDIILDGETGFLVPQKDSQALADKLAILLLNPDMRKQMGTKGRQRFEKLFTLQQFEARIVSILNNAAGMTS